MTAHGKQQNVSAEMTVAFAVLMGLAVVVATASRAVGQTGTGSPVSATPMAQFNGPLMSLPRNNFPVSRQSGLTLQVDPRWTNGYGYRPVKVTVTSLQPQKSTRSIRIELHVGWQRDLNIEQTFEFPAGQTTASTTISLPIYQSSMNYFWWDLWVDNIRDKDLSLNRLASLSWAGGGANSNVGVTFLVIGPPARNRTLVATNAMELQVFALAQAEFPKKWVDYTTFDVVALSLIEIQQLAKNDPAVFRAILKWVRSGGQLWICDVGQQWDNLPRTSQLTGLSESLFSSADESRVDHDDSEPGADDPTTSGEQPQENDENATVEARSDAADSEDAREPEGERRDAPAKPSSETSDRVRQDGWRPLRFLRPRSNGLVITFMDTRTGARRTVRDPEVMAQLQDDANFVTTDQRFDHDVPAGSERRFPADSSEWFVQQPMGFGVVRAFRGPNEAARFAMMPVVANPNVAANTEVTPELPRALSIAIRRAPRWETRHGLTPDSSNVEFAKLLVPGVGLAPVTEFRILITIFVLFIGPINYWLLKRAKCLHLMVISVPAAAILTTLALFAYAIVADGFETQVRTHSFTKLDQRTGESACWARLSYYSGLAPGDGLTLPDDISIYPIIPNWAGSGDFSEQRSIVSEGHEMRLVRGWLNSRTPTQYLSIRSRKSPNQLEVLDSGDKLRVNNHLGSGITYLVLINRDGNVFEGESVPRNGSAMLRPTTRDDAIRRLNKIVMSNLPQAPEPLAGGESDLSFVRTRSRFQMYGRYGGPNTGGRLSDNFAGTALIDLIGLGGQPALDLPAKSYVAITEHGPEVESGIDYAKEDASFHVIEGRW